MSAAPDFDLQTAERVAAILGPYSAAALALNERKHLLDEAEDVAIIVAQGAWHLVPRRAFGELIGS